MIVVADILRQFRYYLVDQDKPKVAERFLVAVERTIERIVRMPATNPCYITGGDLMSLATEYHCRGAVTKPVLYYAVRRRTSGCSRPRSINLPSAAALSATAMSLL